MSIASDRLILKSRLQSLLESLVRILEEQNENNWSVGFSNLLNNLNDDNLGESARSIRRSFGGMGSFSDLVLCKDHKMLVDENNQLEKLKNDIYDTCLDVLKSNAALHAESLLKNSNL